MIRFMKGFIALVTLMVTLGLMGCSGSGASGESSGSGASGESSGSGASGGSGTGGGTPATTHTIGGAVSGLAGTVVLQNNGGDNLTLSANGAFTFATALNNAALYNVTVLTHPAGHTCSVANGNGAVSGTNVAHVTIVCKSWRGAELIETDNAGNAYSQQIAFGANGDAMAVWQQWDGTHFNIFANRYTFGTGWGTAALIETNNTMNAAAPQIAVDAEGNAIAVWLQWDGSRSDIWANRYTADAGWGTAELIETDTNFAHTPQIAVGVDGNAIAVWWQWDGNHYSIFANRYTAGTGWGTAELIETDNAGSAWDPQIAVDAEGNAIAVWLQWDGSRSDIWANRYTADAGWGPAELIETDNAMRATGPQIAVDADGNAMAVWMRYDGNRFDGYRYRILANRYTAGAGWGTAALIETGNTRSVPYSPQITVDASDNAMAVWSRSGDILANRYSADTGWGTAELIATDNTRGAIAPQIAGDAKGNAMAVWQQLDGSSNIIWNIWANRYSADTGWGTAELIEPDNAGSAWNPQIAVDAGGNAIAVWSQYDGQYGDTRSSIFANRYE